MDHSTQSEVRKVWPIDLRGLILVFVLLSVLATLANSLVMAYRVQRDALITHALHPIALTQQKWPPVLVNSYALHISSLISAPQS
ncbi:hypothetical protein D3C72_2276710 [compost metagenome]